MLKRFAADEAGATAIEYSLIAALIAIVVLTAMTLMAGSASNIFNYITDNTLEALSRNP